MGLLLEFGLSAGILAIIGAVVWWRFAIALGIHRGRVHRGSLMVSSQFGQIEFATAGRGVPLLVVHGAGGGFDQAIFGAGRLVAAGYQIIAPSRFGYLRSSSPDDPSPQNQADALAALLDQLQIQSIPIVGISAGSLSALQFALRHPARCRSLIVIVPAASVAGNVLPAQGPLPDQGPLARAITGYILKSDFLFWLGINLIRDQMIRSVLATNPALVAAASSDERERTHAILWNILPISERSQGLRNDTRFTSTPQSIALDQIKAPALVISLEDDFYRTIAPARFIAAKIPGARLVTYATGGHIWIGHDAELFAEVNAFLRQN